LIVDPAGITAATSNWMSARRASPWPLLPAKK
jgi:hypothetical protein